MAIRMFSPVLIKRLTTTRKSSLLIRDAVVNASISSNRLCSSSHVEDKSRNPATYFFREDVQDILMTLNGSDLTKVFSRRKEGQPLQKSEIKLMTDQQLEEAMDKMKSTARYYLQPPPVLLPREEINVQLSNDPILKGLEDSNIVFTDITYGVEEEDRLITVREPNGVLRYATWGERHRMNEVYFHKDGRTLQTPAMFSPENLPMILERRDFEFVLDRACIQFDPNDSEYIRITSTVYKYIEESSLFDDLIGTRHYGSMIFYFVFHGMIENYLLHCFTSGKIQNAVLVLTLHYITNPTVAFSPPKNDHDVDFIQEYIKNHGIRKTALTAHLNAYLELKLPRESEVSL